MSEDVASRVSGSRLLSRRRRENVAGGRQHAHKVLVTPEEEGRLVQRALEQRVSIPRLLIESALAQQPGETASERREVIAELFALHRLLATVANNVNQMARATNATHEVQADMRATLLHVRRVADRIDAAVDALAPGQ